MKNKSDNLISLSSFRKKREVQNELSPNRKPLYVSHLDGKISGTSNLNNTENKDFGGRLQRIRSSLDRINGLMTELKDMSSETK